ncbi:TPA: restriction endonuclease subunit S [Streptococcus suis]
MTPEQLKASILQRAMEGKLVPQDPNDEPASELLKRIKEEKEKLISEGKVKRDKKETEFFRGDDGKPYEKLADGTVKKVEVPYEIPDSWEWVRVGKICSTNIVLTFKPSEVQETGIPVYKANNIKNSKICTQDLVFVSETTIIKDNEWLNKDDILMAVRSGSKQLVGKTAIINDLEIKTSFGAFMSVIRPISVFPTFMHYFFQSSHFRSQLDEANTTTIFQVTQKMLKDTLLPLPPIAEQKRIVAQIERALEKVEVYAESYHKLQELDKAFPDKLKKSILQYAMQGKLIAQDPNDEPVEVLLEKIRAEKQKLYEEGKLKKKDLAEMIVEKGDDNSPYGKNGNFDMDFHRKSNWLLLPLEKVVVSVPTKNHQIKHSDIKSIGMFPVVSQSQVLVEGFSDDKTKVLDNQEHLIIFGDHTRTVKLIDFSFIVGADGVKILQPIGISPQFLKYHLECTILFVKDRGYARHYSYLKNKLIGIPSTDEQNKITNKIDLLFEKVAQL